MIGYRNAKARQEAIARSNGICQFCGIAPAEEAHHWAWPKYPKERKLTSDDLIALCQPCHQIATYMRRLHKHGNDSAVPDFHTALAEMVKRVFGMEN